MVAKLLYCIAGLTFLVMIGGFILGLIPFIVAGLIVLLPIYGVFHTKGNGLLTTFFKTIRRMKFLGFKSVVLITVTLVLLHNQIIPEVIRTLIMGVGTTLLMMVVWEATRKILKATKKYPLPSFGAVVKAAF